MEFKAIIEGLLFVSGDEGLSVEEICNIIETEKENVILVLKKLYNEYEQDDRGIRLELLGNKYKLTTKAEHKNYYKNLIKIDENSTLSQSSLEVLSIIAYNGPITRVQIDEIRGVNGSYIIRKLLIKGLIEEVGHADTAGNPRLYNITNKFLDYFGLGSIKELPEINISNESNNEEQNLFNSRYKEN